MGKYTMGPESNKPDYKVTESEMRGYPMPQSIRVAILGLSILIILTILMLIIQGTRISNLHKAYVVTDLPIIDNKTKFFYNEMHTINGNKLPIFDKAPIVNIQPLGIERLYLTDNNKNYVEITRGSNRLREVKFSLWIIDR